MATPIHDPKSRSGVVGQCGLVAKHGAVVDGDVAAEVTTATDNRLMHDRLSTDAAVRPDDGAFDVRVFVDLGLFADDRVGTDARASLDQHALVDETRPFDSRAV